MHRGLLASVNQPRLSLLAAALFAVALSAAAGGEPGTVGQGQASAAPASAAAALPATPASSTAAATPTTATPTAPPAAAPASLPGAAPGSESPEPEILVEGNEPRYVARTTRDRIGRIWAPVLIDGKGPFRLVLDTGANHSAIIPSTAVALGNPAATTVTLVNGFTGSAVVPTIAVSSLEVGELLLGPTTLPVVADVFGGAQGVLGNEGLQGKRILADFGRDRLVISRSHGNPAQRGFSVVPFKLIGGGLPIADLKVGGIHCKAIIDTGAQGTVGNLPLREALMRRPPRNAARADIEGVTLDVQSGDSLPAPQIELGGLDITGVHIIFGDMYLFDHWHLNDRPVLLLGMDLLGSFDVLIIDYKMREMQVQLSHPRL